MIRDINPGARRPDGKARGARNTRTPGRWRTVAQAASPRWNCDATSSRPKEFVAGERQKSCRLRARSYPRTRKRVKRPPSRALAQMRASARQAARLGARGYSACHDDAGRRVAIRSEWNASGRLGRGNSRAHAAHGAPRAMDPAVAVTHECVGLAALEVVDMHGGRPVRLLPPDHQELRSEMRDR
jgi:hypothetical protein